MRRLLSVFGQGLPRTCPNDEGKMRDRAWTNSDVASLSAGTPVNTAKSRPVSYFSNKVFLTPTFAEATRVNARGTGCSLLIELCLELPQAYLLCFYPLLQGLVLPPQRIIACLQRIIMSNAGWRSGAD